MLRSLVSLLILVTTTTATTGLVAVHAQGQPARPAAKRASSAKKPGVIVNLNTASQIELEELPGIGPKAAARIIEYREHKGPFKKIEDLMNVQGIGEKSFLRLKAQITTGANAGHSPQ
jgi:comEA protein